jgi:hypothetical protein
MVQFPSLGQYAIIEQVEHLAFQQNKVFNWYSRDKGIGLSLGLNLLEAFLSDYNAYNNQSTLTNYIPMKKFFSNFKIALNDPLGDKKSCESELFADFKVLRKMRGEFDGTAS